MGRGIVVVRNRGEARDVYNKLRCHTLPHEFEQYDLEYSTTKMLVPLRCQALGEYLRDEMRKQEQDDE